MKILFLTLMKMQQPDQMDIYSSLMREFISHDHDVYVVSPIERKDRRKVKERMLPRSYGRLHLHFAHTGNFFQTGWMEKGLTTLLLSRQYKRVILEEMGDISFDLILYSTPPITFSEVVSYLKRRYHAVTYLMLKDIWPQSMADMKTLKQTGLQGIIYKYFQLKEWQLYRQSDHIGCMSPACARYVLRHNRYLKRDRIEICPNAVNLSDAADSCEMSAEESDKIRKKYGIPADEVVFVFGGNIGKGHDPDFLEGCIKENEKRKNTFLLFVGKGIYYERIKKAVQRDRAKHTKILPFLSQREYERLMKACDVGMIVLDHRFTVPNCPSRILSYLKDKKPVILATDPVSDVGPIAEKNGYGYWCESIDPKQFISLMDRFTEPCRRKEMGERGYQFLLKYYHTKAVYEKIIRHL